MSSSLVNTRSSEFGSCFLCSEWARSHVRQKPSNRSLKIASSTDLAYRKSGSLLSKYVACELFM